MVNSEKFIGNIIDQILELQIKLGYARETVRLYYPVGTLNQLLDVQAADVQEILQILNTEKELTESSIGPIAYGIHKGRIEIRISEDAVRYVHEKICPPAFLSRIIRFFGENHHAKIDEIRALFAGFSADYVCEEMPEGSDFDYALYFKDESIDLYVYCVKMEMGHSIYHRFTREDYKELLQ